MTYVILAAVALLIFFFLRHRSTARAITKSSNREVWAQASDARFPRHPRRANPFGKTKGLK